MTRARIMTAVAVVMLSLLVCGCAGERCGTIMPADIGLRPGDVVLRRGSGLTSRAVLMADSGGGYSHVGIAVDSAGVMMVVHAVPGEPDYPGEPDRVKMEPAERFYAPVSAERGCVMRCDDSTVAVRAAQVALRLYRRGVLFDHDYDSRDTVRMYCCELVEYAYTRAGMPLATGPRHSFCVPGMRIDSVILPSDYCRSERLRQITAF